MPDASPCRPEVTEHGRWFLHVVITLLGWVLEQSGLGRKTPPQWIGVTHVQLLIPQEPPRTPGESQGRRRARPKSPIALSIIGYLFPSSKVQKRPDFDSFSLAKRPAVL